MEKEEMMNHVMPLRALLIVLIGTVYSVTTASAQTSSSDGQRTKWEIQASIRSGSKYTFSNFPLFIRAVPVHEDDGYLSSGMYEHAHDTLPDARLQLTELAALDVTALYHLDTKLAVGIIYTLHSSAGGIDDPSKRVQRNQYGTSGRGIGKSLRFYQPSGNSLYQFGLTAELSTPWWKLFPWVCLKPAVMGVYDLTGFMLKTKAGWDRYNNDETWKSDDLARLYEHRALISLYVGFPDRPDKFSKRFNPKDIWGLKLSYLQPFYHLVWKNTSGTVFNGQTQTPRWEVGLFYSF